MIFGENVILSVLHLQEIFLTRVFQNDMKALNALNALYRTALIFKSGLKDYFCVVYIKAAFLYQVSVFCLKEPA